MRKQRVIDPTTVRYVHDHDGMALVRRVRLVVISTQHDPRMAQPDAGDTDRQGYTSRRGTRAYGISVYQLGSGSIPAHSKTALGTSRHPPYIIEQSDVNLGRPGPHRPAANQFKCIAAPTTCSSRASLRGRYGRRTILMVGKDPFSTAAWNSFIQSGLRAPRCRARPRANSNKMRRTAGSAIA